MKRNERKTIGLRTLLMSLLVLVSLSVWVPERAEAASKKIKVGKSVTFSVKKKAKWANSNKKVASIRLLSSKKVKITGLRPGSTKVTAKVGKKKYSCKVTVKAAKVKKAKKTKVKKSKKGGGQVAGAVRVSSSKIPGSPDSVFYVDTGATVTGHFEDSMANDLIAATNSYRGQSGIGTLAADPALIAAARVRAYEIAVTWGHTRPNGTQYYTVNSDVVYGENLAYGYDNASDTMSGWRGSATHNANLQRDQFTRIGIAVVAVKQSDGSYVNYIAQEFG